MRYAKAVTDEREKYWRERKAICEGRITARSADGTLMGPTQAFEDAQARYVDACAPIIVQAYHDGNYDGFWQALSNATHTDNFIYYKNAAFHIIEQTIMLTGLLEHGISDGALHDTSFARAVARDTIKNSDDHPNGVHRLFGRLYDWGDFNALKTSNPSFTAARNAVALGSRIMEELANTVTNDEELINNALKLCAPTGLAEHAYLAGADNSDDNILSRIGRKNFHETTSNFMVTSASYGIVYALCGDVQGAAARWRSIISDAETNRDEAREIEARCAHMKLCGALMERGVLPADDLWDAMVLMGDSLYDCDAFRIAASALADDAIYDPSTTLHGLVKQLSEESENLTVVKALTRRETMKTIMRGIIENAARVVLENMSKASKPHSLIPTEHSIFTNACVCEHFMLADSSAATLGRLIIWKDTRGLLLRSITAGSYHLDTCSTDALTVAAERWRDIIDNTDVDAPERREARYAHTAIAATLFACRGTITTGDLSALIDMFNEQDQAREAGKGTLTLSFHDPLSPYESHVNSA